MCEDINISLIPELEEAVSCLPLVNKCPNYCFWVVVQEHIKKKYYFWFNNVLQTLK
jgi:hypothetical protein